MVLEMSSQAPRRKIVVTGATGYIGNRLTDLAISQGFEVVALTRRPVSRCGVVWREFDLASPGADGWPTDVLAVIHLAAQTSSSTALTEDDEIHAAECLIRATNRHSARFIFVSSQTARLDAPTKYGRTKAIIEAMVLAGGGIVVRPGQVYGGISCGLFGTLVRAVERLPVLPGFVPSPLVQPIHVDDLAKGLMVLASSETIPSKVFRLGSSEPVTFTQFLETIARCRLRRRRIFFPIPRRFVLFMTYCLGTSLTHRLGFGQLLSLFELPPMETGEDMRLLGLSLRTLADGMARSGYGLRRRQLQEGKAMLWYVLRERPAGSLLRRYFRMLAALEKPSALEMPACMARFPGLIALADEPHFRLSKPGSEFGWRLDAATLIAEASPQGAVRFLGDRQHTGFIQSVIRLGYAVTSELICRLLGLVWRLCRGASVLGGR